MSSKEYLTLTPTIGGSFSYGWKKMYETFPLLLVIVIISGIIQGPLQSTHQADHFHFWMVPAIIFGIAWGFLLVPVISYGEKLIFLKAMREEKPDIKELFIGFKNQYLDIILAHLIVFALVMIGFFMLIIPGIIIACKLAFVPYLVMDKHLEPMEAVEKSWKMTKGHGWTIFGMAIITFFLCIAGLIVFLVGIIISIMWMHSAFASLYQAVLNDEIRNETIPIIEVHEG